MDEDDFLFGYRVNILEEVGGLPAHNDQFIGQIGQFGHDGTIFRRGIIQYRVQGRHHRHAQITQQFQQMTAGRPTENTVFVLHADDIRLIDIEKLRRGAVIAQLVLIDLETYVVRVRVSLGFVVHDRRPAADIRCFRRQRLNQVRGEGGDGRIGGANNCR